MKDPTRVIAMPDTAAKVRGSLSAIYQAGKSPFAAKDLQAYTPETPEKCL